jgi:hypothetical protein
MIPIVDARSGKVIKVGDTVEYPRTILIDGSRSLHKSGFELKRVFAVGLFSAKAEVLTFDEGHQYTQIVPMPIKWFPKSIYGARFPVDGWRAAIFPS